MPWKGLTVSEQRENLLRDYHVRYYSLTELAERYSVSRKTAYKWIGRYAQSGKAGLEDLPRRPLSCPWQTEARIAEALVGLRRAHATWGPDKLLNVLERRHPRWNLPVASTAARILSNHGLVRVRSRHRRAHPGCPHSTAADPHSCAATTGLLRHD